ncbi:MAG: putative toxin-antitoxin system toxin component, PIN family [Gammaproteobacteria bacterium]
MGREDLLRASPLNATERSDLLDIFLGCCEWTRVYFGWRPNLPDEADNHLIELAVAGAAPFIVTRNLRDFARADLRFPGLSAVNPHTFLKEIETWQP